MSYNQMRLLSQRTPIEKVLEDPTVTEDVKKKLRLIQKARVFAIEELGLLGSENYKTYVDLKRPYVSYLVRVAYAYELKPYLWNYPIVGKLPYKGFFSLEEAKKEASLFKNQGYDTYVRGTTAYSSLGWWDEPILSSMLSYRESSLIETIFHEMVHGTVFIKGRGDFNERLATFLGQKGVELYYLKKEGVSSLSLQAIRKRNKDRKEFSLFISREIKSLSHWYEREKKKGKISREEKEKRLARIQKNFVLELKGKLQTSNYGYFEKISLNNARLLSYKTYVYDLSDFEILLTLFERDFKKLVSFFKGLKSRKNPKEFIKDFIETETSVSKRKTFLNNS